MRDLGYDCSNSWLVTILRLGSCLRFILKLVTEAPIVKHVTCWNFLPRSLMLLHACEELNAKFSRFGEYLVKMKNTKECFMKFDKGGISLTHESYWSKSVRNWYHFFTRYVELLPILHGVKCEN